MNIIPKPVEIMEREVSFDIKKLSKAVGDPSFKNEMEVFNIQCGEFIYSGPEILVCEKDSSLKSESYTLSIDSDRVRVAAADGAGICHGLQTLRQLLLSREKEIPCCKIKDHPRFSWRGYMLDCSRHFFTVPFIKKMIDTLSLHQINKFHWHLCDDQGWRFPVKGWPALIEKGSRRETLNVPGREYGGFYTAEEIRDIVSFAAVRHVEIIPEVDLPGHTSAVLASYPDLGCSGGPYRVEDRYGIFEDVLCAGNDRIFDFFAAVFDALAELFPSDWIHIGGDEVLYNHWSTCPKCQKRLEEQKLSKARELQSWITYRLVRMLAERGKTAIGWDEILEDSKQFPLPENAVIMSWRGRERGLEACRRGRKVIMSPNTEGCYLDYKHSEDPEEPGNIGVSPLSSIYNMDPLSPGMKESEAALVMGGQANLWTELVPNGKLAEYMSFPRICALAEGLWTPKDKKNYEDFTSRLAVHRLRLDRLGVLQYRGE
ncbi:MAG: beta-N-acetylhexosaminidase [Treponema sp.]|nr:beta-N-acetylhexosaminidase [Treponema sp.]